MKKFLFKNGLYGLFLSLIAVLILGHASFAVDFGDIQRYTKVKIIQDNGEFGLARVKFVGKTGREFKKMLESVADSTKPIDVYAAYTSYQANTNPFENVYWPWVFPNQAFLFVAFKTNKSNQQVTITWRLFDWKPQWSNTPYNQVSWNFDNTTLNPNWWYFAWYNPSPSVLSKGYWRCSTIVTASGGGSDEDNCRFMVINPP